MNDRICLSNKNMRALFDAGGRGIMSLTSPYDEYKADFVLTPEEFPEYDVKDCQWLGNVGGAFSVEGEDIRFSTGTLKDNADLCAEGDRVQIRYPKIRNEKGEDLFFLKSDFLMKEQMLEWTISLVNVSDQEMDFRDLNIPLLMNQFFRGDDDFKYDRCVMRHTCITGHSSYLYWEKSSGNGPVLLFAPLGDNVLVDLRQEKEDPLFGKRVEEGCAYEGIVRAYTAAEDSVLGPDIQGSFLLGAGETKRLRFVLTFVETEGDISHKLEELSLTVLKAVPGMTGPVTEDFFVMTRPADAEVAVCDAGDRIVQSDVRNGWKVSRIRFGGCGRRYIRVKNRENTALFCFFATEDIAGIITKHARFIAQNQLETEETDPCYHGILMWDMTQRRRINSSFHPYPEDWWRGGSDDPGLAGGLFLSEKNVYLPEREEIRVLNAFVEDFILQRLTEQPGWRVHRMVPWYTMFEPWAGRGADDVWRAFNYVHVINIVYNMYRIQKRNDLAFLRQAQEYLIMAYDYTMAMFHYWMFPDGVGAGEFGNMGEMTLPLWLEKSLKEEGFIQEAAQIGAVMDKKAHFFDSREFPFGSEMAYDSTAFEAVYAYGRRIESDHIMRAAAKAAFSNRGKQPVWFLYNTDLRAGGDTSWNSSYMTQLGAYPILDYTLDRGHVGEDWILSYYGSYLSGWLLYNSEGYWDGDRANTGATGWITEASKINSTEKPPGCHMPLLKGCVALSGEAGIGFFGALRTACSLVIEHSILGRIGLGCEVITEGGRETVSPRDGLSVRFYYVPGRWKAEAEGGSLDRIVICGNEIRIFGTPLNEKGMKIRLLTIPEAGKAQELLYCQELSADEKEFRFELLFG